MYACTMSAITTLIEDLVSQKPGITERELADDVLGPGGDLNQLEQLCLHLIEQGKIERRGEGTDGSPYTFYPRSNDA